jgi:hypothetical protein
VRRTSAPLTGRTSRNIRAPRLRRSTPRCSPPRANSSRCIASSGRRGWAAARDRRAARYHHAMGTPARSSDPYVLIALLAGRGRLGRHDSQQRVTSFDAAWRVARTDRAHGSC